MENDPNNPNPQGSTNQNEPLNPTPPNPSNTEPDNRELLAAALRETQLARIAAENQAADYRRQLEAHNQQQAIQNAPNYTSEEFFKDPFRILKEAIDSQVAPLRADAARITRQQSYFQLKSQFQSHPQYAQLVSTLSSGLDQYFLAPNSQLSIDAGTFQNVLSTLVGQTVMSNPGAFNQQQNTPQNQVQNTPTSQQVLPPHLRPSPSVAPTPQTSHTPQQRNYTENERRLMKEFKMSEAEWEHYTTGGNVPGDKYVAPKGGK